MLLMMNDKPLGLQLSQVAHYGYCWRQDPSTKVDLLLYTFLKKNHNLNCYCTEEDELSFSNIFQAVNGFFILNPRQLFHLFGYVALFYFLWLIDDAIDHWHREKMGAVLQPVSQSQEMCGSPDVHQLLLPSYLTIDCTGQA